MLLEDDAKKMRGEIRAMASAWEKSEAEIQRKDDALNDILDVLDKLNVLLDSVKPDRQGTRGSGAIL